MLASLSDPPETARLEHCDSAIERRAIATLRARYERKRAMLESRAGGGLALERVRSGLRRLGSSELRAFRDGSAVILSEPFAAVPRSGRAADPSVTRDLVAKLVGGCPPAALCVALAPFGERALSLAVRGRVRIAIVPKNRPFARCSPAVAALVPDIDRWHAPPAGLFVLEERLVLLRPGALRMAAAHEFAHALDALLAARPRSYFSFEDEGIRGAYAAASGFVNEYAASGLDEYFAESLRAYVEVNDDRSCWLPLTRQALQTRDSRMFSILEALFREARL